jgi:DNA-binding FadR family transcriptional regulator
MVDIARAPRLHERLARALAREIVSGERAEGSAFPPSEELAEQAGVSRTVARDAIQALTAAGLLDVQHGKRTLVNPVTQWRFLEPLVQDGLSEARPNRDLARQSFEVRSCLEIEAARLCAERASDAQLDAIRDQAGAMAERLAGAVPSEELFAWLVPQDLAFHRLIAEATDNMVLLQLIVDVRRGLAPTWALEQLAPGELEEIGRQHAEIAAALHERDPDAATAAMRAHLGWTSHTTIDRAH